MRGPDRLRQAADILNAGCRVAVLVGRGAPGPAVLDAVADANEPPRRPEELRA